MSIIGTFRLGEDIAVALDALSGDVGTVSAITAALAQTEQTGGNWRVKAGGSSVAMTAVDRAAAGDIPAGWTLTLIAGSAPSWLVPGVYAIDARLTVGSALVITATSALVKISRSAFA